MGGLTMTGMVSPPTGRRLPSTGSHDAEDLRDEDEGVPTLDSGLRHAALAVTQLGGNRQQDA